MEKRKVQVMNRNIIEPEIMLKLHKAEQEYPYFKTLKNAPDVHSIINNVDIRDLSCFKTVNTTKHLNSLSRREQIELWWQVVKKSCEIHGFFTVMKAQDDNLNLTERYFDLTVNRNMLSFYQASKYNRLGKFLKKFPKFIYQRQWFTLHHWVEKSKIISLATIKSIFTE